MELSREPGHKSQAFFYEKDKQDKPLYTKVCGCL
jgi:hypothetical protein